MNRTPRPVAGDRRAAVKALWEAMGRQDVARRRREALLAMSKIASATVKPKGPRRDSKGRFVKAS